MQSRINDIHAAGAEVIAVSTDPIEDSKQRLASLNLTFPILSDPQWQAIDAYGVRHPAGNDGKDIARPATFIIDGHGVIRWRDLKDNYRERVRPEEILKELAKIQ